MRECASLRVLEIFDFRILEFENWRVRCPEPREASFLAARVSQAQTISSVAGKQFPLTFINRFGLSDYPRTNRFTVAGNYTSGREKNWPRGFSMKHSVKRIQLGNRARSCVILYIQQTQIARLQTVQCLKLEEALRSSELRFPDTRACESYRAFVDK